MFKIEKHIIRLLASAKTDDSHAEYQGSTAGEGSHGAGDAHGDGHGEFGVHVTYDIIYHSMVFFAVIYLAGAFASRVLRMPNLVGEIFAGIILGPPLLNFVPNPEAFVMLGEVGLFLLVLEAGIDIDLTMLKLIGARGVMIAIVGSILPIAIGMGIAFAFGTDVKGAIAAGSAFGPTSLGIAMNILRAGKIVNTPVGQLIVSAAVIDDMIALIILSQLQALTGPSSVVTLVVPIISALAFLIIGGYIAIFLAPPVLNRYVISRFSEEQRGRVELALMLGFMLALMPATYYAKASPLMGAFIAGLVFCSSHDLHHQFVSQFKRVMQWLMRIFFAASIGFQVPVTHFASGSIILQGLVYTLALLGKLFTGLMVPNFTQSSRYRGFHLRDCLATGFSMAAEGEFAFVIAVFAVGENLISKDLYASIVLAVLISTIIPPFALRFTISYFNKKSEKAVADAAELELNRNMELDTDKALLEGLQSKTAVFLCIQTQSHSSWGLLPKIMQTLQKMGIEVIDHRSWHPRGVNTTLVNEIYAQDSIKLEKDTHTSANDTLSERLGEVQQKLLEAINQKDVAKVKVARWFPGVVTEITEDITDDDDGTGRKKKARAAMNISQLISNEASKKLEADKERQTNATVERPVEEILKNVPLPDLDLPEDKSGFNKPKSRKRRQKMMSSPAIGSDMFSAVGGFKASGAPKDSSAGAPKGGDFWAEVRSFEAKTGTVAELVVGREVFNVRIAPTALARVRKSLKEDVILSGSDLAPTSSSDGPPQNFEHKLMGFVRGPMLAQITEESVDGEHEAGGGGNAMPLPDLERGNGTNGVNGNRHY